MYAKNSPAFVGHTRNLAFHAGPGETVNANPDAVCPAHLKRAEVLGELAERVQYVIDCAISRGLPIAPMLVVSGAKGRMLAVKDIFEVEVEAMDGCIASGDVFGGQSVARSVVAALPGHRCALDGVAVALRGAARSYGPDQSDIWMLLLDVASKLSD